MQVTLKAVDTILLKTYIGWTEDANIIQISPDDAANSQGSFNGHKITMNGAGEKERPEMGSLVGSPL